MHIIRAGRAALDSKAAAFVADAISHATRSKGRAVVGLVGGRSVGGLYARLRESNVDWDHVDFFVADERVVPITSPESNWGLVSSDLLDGLTDTGLLPAGNAHAYLMDATAPDHGLSTYAETLEETGGTFDVAILSAGEDGHCASIFPRHPSVRDDSPGFILVRDSPKPPPLRISASRRLLERTSAGVIYFLGEGKRAALDLFLDGTKSVYDCPSKVVRSMAESLVLTDL